MKAAEKHKRLERMQNRIADYNVFTWAYDFFKQTYDTKKHQELMSVKFINASISSQIATDYQKALRRIFFLDYDGTLVSFAKYPELATIDENSLEIVTRLAGDPKNQVVIISGRDKDFLEKQFKDVKVTMVAEHGYFTKNPHEPWNSSVNSDAQWKEVVMPILMEYVNRCNGTFIEEKTGSLAWHYRNADSDFAQLRLHELRDDLAEIIRYKTDFEILEGHKVLEVKSGRYDKGQAATFILNNNQFDFILAAGDDKTDELLFQAMPDNAYTVRVGLSPSFAKYNVSDFSVLLNLLKTLGE
jgi:trehalose 6-phosphate synthase/phosphatase